MLSITFLYRYAECHYDECRYAECRSVVLPTWPQPLDKDREPGLLPECKYPEGIGATLKYGTLITCSK